MSLKRVTSAAIMTAMLAAPAARVEAGSGDFAGGLVGGLIGGAIGSNLANQNRQKRSTRTIYVQPRASSAQRQENREIQSSLNYFSFNAGVEDGILGSGSRAAISRYQGYMGFPVSGTLTSYQKSVLLGAYNRAMAGGPDVNRIISRSNQGARALLIAQRDGGAGPRSAGYAGLPAEVSDAVDEVAESSDPSAEQLLQRSGFIQLADLNGDGKTDYILDTALAGSSFWCNADQCKTMVFASTPEGYRRNDLLVHEPSPAKLDCVGSGCVVRATPAAPARTQPQTQMASASQARAQGSDGGAAGLGSLPVFNTAPKPRSLSSFCSKVSLLTSSNGGFTQASEVTDPNFAISEQLCLTRTYAVAAGEDLIATIQGADQDAIDRQCDAFGKSLKPQVAGLARKSASMVLADVNRVILDSGMTPEQLRTTARVCMASGYKADKMAPAIGGALLLTALGERPYAELVGHHLLGGFGTDKNPDMGMGWYAMVFDALDAGAAPVFARTQPERIDVVRAAAAALSGQGGAASVPVSSGDSGSLPVFSIAE